MSEYLFYNNSWTAFPADPSSPWPRVKGIFQLDYLQVGMVRKNRNMWSTFFPFQPPKDLKWDSPLIYDLRRGPIFFRSFLHPWSNMIYLFHMIPFVSQTLNLKEAFFIALPWSPNKTTCDGTYFYCDFAADYIANPIIFVLGKLFLLRPWKTTQSSRTPDLLVAEVRLIV